MRQFVHFNKKIKLENGEIIPELTIAYDTYGTLSAEKDNVIWVCHALTANSDVKQWWPGTVEQGSFLDPLKYFIICANFLGSHYGTTGPLSKNPETGEPYYDTFPEFTVRDMVMCHQMLAEYLDIKCVKMLIGSSIGGFQCLEWAVIQPEFPQKLVLIATSARSKPWAIALNESQRMAIEADNTFGEKSPEAGLTGMAVARSIALLSYRGQAAYDNTQEDIDADTKLSGYRVTTYQQHQGDKIKSRFNAYSYYRLTQAVDSHNLARSRGCIEDALHSIRSKTLIIAITSDILFTPSEHDIMVKWIPDTEYHLIDSNFGHDGFLVENKKLKNIILSFL